MSCGEFAEQSGSESSWGWQNKCARYSPRYLSTHHLQIPKFPGPFEFAASPIHWSLNRDKDDLSCIFTQVNIEYSWKHCQQFVWKWTQTSISKLRIIILVSEILDTNYHRVELRARRDIVWPECFKWWYMIFWLNCFDEKYGLWDNYDDNSCVCQNWVCNHQWGTKYKCDVCITVV